MLFKNKVEITRKQLIFISLSLILLIGLLLYIINSVNIASTTEQNVFAYTVKVRDTVEEIDKIFERAEVNVNVMVDSISNSYDVSKQQDKAYNLHYLKEIDGLVKSVLTNSPNVDGSWLQLNADLPFSAQAYNWYEFRNNEFINEKDKLYGTPSMNRRITPEDDPYYFNAITNQKPTWSDIYTDVDNKKKMITISAPIYSMGRLVGVVGIDISADNLRQTLKDMQSILGDSELYLLDKKNKVILSQLPYLSISSKDNYPFLDSFSINNEGPVEYYDHLTKKTAILLTLSNDYKIIIAIGNKSLFKGTNQLCTIVYILFILLILLIALGLAYQFRISKLEETIKVLREESDLQKTQEENDDDAYDSGKEEDYNKNDI